MLLRERNEMTNQTKLTNTPPLQRCGIVEHGAQAIFCYYVEVVLCYRVCFLISAKSIDFSFFLKHRVCELVDSTFERQAMRALWQA